MSTPGPASPSVLSLRDVSKAFGAVRRSARSASTAARARSTRSSGRTGPGSRHCSGSPAASSRPTTGPSRSTASSAGGSPRQRPAGSASASRTRRTRMSSTCRSPRTSISAAPPELRPRYGRMEAWAAETLGAFDLDIPLTATTRSLSLVQRQLLEVVKALLAKPKVLLLDEPTTALGPDDVERLHALVLEQSRAGVGIVYVSHRLPEVLGIADRVTVLRDGVCQGTFEAASMSEESLVALMIGVRSSSRFPTGSDAGGGTRGATRRLGSAGRAVRPGRPRGGQGRDPRDRRRRGQRAGAVPPCPRRCRALRRHGDLRRAGARLRLAARRRSARASCC